MGMEPAYPEVLATHLCDNHGIRPVQVGRAREWVTLGVLAVRSFFFIYFFKSQMNTSVEAIRQRMGRARCPRIPG